MLDNLINDKMLREALLVYEDDFLNREGECYDMVETSARFEKNMKKQIRSQHNIYHKMTVTKTRRMLCIAAIIMALLFSSLSVSAVRESVVKFVADTFVAPIKSDGHKIFATESTATVKAQGNETASQKSQGNDKKEAETTISEKPSAPVAVNAQKPDKAIDATQAKPEESIEATERETEKPTESATENDSEKILKRQFALQMRVNEDNCFMHIVNETRSYSICYCTVTDLRKKAVKNTYFGWQVVHSEVLESPYELGIYIYKYGNFMTLAEALKRNEIPSAKAVLDVLRDYKGYLPFDIFDIKNFKVGTINRYDIYYYYIDADDFSKTETFNVNLGKNKVIQQGMFSDNPNTMPKSGFYIKGKYADNRDNSVWGLDEAVNQNLFPEAGIKALLETSEYNGKLWRIQDMTSKPESDTVIVLGDKSGTVYTGKTLKILAAVANPVGETQYTSTDKEIATVSAKGVVTGHKAGKTVIRVSNNGLYREFTVTVKNPTLNKSTKTLKIGESFTIKINGQVKKATFVSSNPKVAKVNSNGKVKALKKGKATVTVKTNGIKLKCKITVK